MNNILSKAEIGILGEKAACSFLKKEGYTVSQRESLSDDERQEIIKSVLSRKLMTKQEIIAHIELQISLRKNNEMYNNAVLKWKRDLLYIKSEL